MKADIRWENEAKTVIRYTYTGDWNWEDFYRILEWRDPDVPHGSEVCVLVDFRQTTRPPSDAILHLKRAAKMAEETEGLIILITNSSALITLYNVFIIVYRAVSRRFRIVSSDREAYAILGLPYDGDS